ncbi:DUF167 domain-containing protein [bacterium]
MQIIEVRVIANSKVNKVIKENGKFKVYVTSLPIEGKANKMVVNLLSEFFKTKKRNIQIIKGEKAKEKLIKLL